MNGTPDPDTPNLAVPEGWIVDDVTSHRLHRQLRRFGRDVAGIVAERSPLPSGSSHRVAAERCSLVGESEVRPASGRRVDGAVLARPGFAVDVGSGSVTVPEGRLLVDRGTTVHDPWSSTGALEDASPLGRPPFPYRPLVLFLGFEADQALAGRLRDLVDELVSQGTEGRLALPVMAPAPHRTRPCLPTEASVQALAPDVIVGVGASAVEAGARWLDGDRSAVVVELDRDLGRAAELVTWRIGRARGRVRARIGPDVAAPELATLVGRLCAGPQTLPPTVRRPAARPLGRRAPRRSRSSPLSATPVLVALLGPGDGAARDRFAALADHAASTQVNVCALDDRSLAQAETADHVVARGCSQADSLLALAERRTRRGLPTIVDLGPEDLVVDADADAASPLVAPASALVRATGRVTTTRRELVERLRLDGARVHVLPTLFRAGRLDGLHRLAAPRRHQGPPVLGCHVAGASLADLVPVDELLGSLLGDCDDLVVEVIGGGDWARALSARIGTRVRCRDDRPRPSAVARWRACVARTGVGARARDEHLDAVVEAQLLGVPTLAGPESPAVLEGLVAGSLRIDPGRDPSAWRRGVEPLLVDPAVRARHSAEAHRLAEALYGSPSATAAIERFLGWARFEGPA